MENVTDLIKAEADNATVQLLLQHVTELCFNALPKKLETRDIDVPLSDIYHYFDVKVQYRGHGRWSVNTFMGAVRRGEFDGEREPLPSSRDDDYLDDYRFEFWEAMAYAEIVQHKMTLKGKTASEWLKEAGYLV